MKSMMSSIEFERYLKLLFPATNIYNGFINKNDDKCIGLYVQGSAQPKVAIGGLEYTSTWILPVRLLIHWTKSSHECETQSLLIYETLLQQQSVKFEGRRIISIQMLDPCPIDIGRGENDICEKVIRLNVIYGRDKENET